MENTQRTVKRTYGKPRRPVEDVGVQDDDDALVTEEPQDNPASSPSSSDDDPDASPEPIVWDALKRGAGANWRRLLADDASDGDPDAEGDEETPGEGDDVYARARRAVLAPPAPEAESSSLPPLTSDDPLALEEEEETYPVNSRKRTIKPSSPASPSPSEDDADVLESTPTRHTPTIRPGRTPTAEVALPSSQPEYQRQQAAHDAQERRRKRAQEEREREREEVHTSPSSPSFQRGESRRRRRRVVAASEDEEDPPREAATSRIPVHASASGGEDSDAEGDGFHETMGRILERARSPPPLDEEAAVPSLEQEPAVGRRTRRRDAEEARSSASERDTGDEQVGRKKSRLRVSPARRTQLRDGGG